MLIASDLADAGNAYRNLLCHGWTLLMRMPWHIGATTSYEEIKIAALIGLQDVIDIQLSIPACVRSRNCLHFGPISETLGEFCVADIEMQCSGQAIQLDPVAFLHHR